MKMVCVVSLVIFFMFGGFVNAQPPLVISEVCTDRSRDHEFIELHNTTDEWIDLQYFNFSGDNEYVRIVRLGLTGDTYTTMISFDPEQPDPDAIIRRTWIKPHGYYLWANRNNDALFYEADALTYNVIGDNDALGIWIGEVNNAPPNEGQLIDSVGWGEAPDEVSHWLVEGDRFPFNPIRTQSIERKACYDSCSGGTICPEETHMNGGHVTCGNDWDSNNNAYDFVLRLAGETDPQNAVDSDAEWPCCPLHMMSCQSVLAHGAPENEFLLRLDSDVNNGIEPRQPGVRKLRIDFTETLDPATVIPENIYITGGRYGRYEDFRMTLSSVVPHRPYSRLEIEFERDGQPLPLPDVNRWIITMPGVTNFQGDHIVNLPLVIGTLAGDIGRDGQVTTGDSASVKPRYQHMVHDNNFIYDYNCDGQITTGDASAIKTKYQHALPPLKK
jgi:hypothetical protein